MDEKCIEEFVDLISEWNDLVEDGDRGRGNDALCLVLYDDGSGKIGRIFGTPETFCVQHEFDTPTELVEFLADWN